MDLTDAQISYIRVIRYWNIWRPLLRMDPSQKRQMQLRNRTIKSLGRQHHIKMY